MSDAPEGPGPAAGHLDLLQRVTEQMTVHRTREDVLLAITRGLVRSDGATLARIWLYERGEACAICRRGDADDAGPVEASSLHLCASAGLFQDLSGPHHRVPLGMFLSGHVAESRAPLLLNDLAAEPRAASLPWVAQHGLRGYAGYPLLFDGELLGVLGLFRRDPWTAGEFRVLSVFAAQAAIAIKTAALVEESERRSARLAHENAWLRDALGDEGEVVGRSPALLDVLQRLDRVALTDTTVLLLGETGTGKELLARAVHARSGRRDGPLVKVNCGAIAPGLVESELFGHEKGAFTGAVSRRAGRFELAEGGTLFLDEVGDLPADVQVKLLRVLQDGEFERVGGAAPLRADVRVVAATHHDLEADVAAGRFRADLYYRLSVFPLRVPPLRERLEDLPALADHLLARLARRLGRPRLTLGPGALERLDRYPWPGNVRELQNVLERAAVLARGETVELVDALGAPDGATASLPPLAEVERRHVQRALDATGGVIDGPHGAARILGLHPNTLRSRLPRLGLTLRGRGGGGPVGS